MTSYKIIQAPNLSEFPNLQHGFTTKELGKDFDRIAVELKILTSQIYSLKQIHSNKVVYLDHNMDLAQIPEADALVTDRKDVVIGVKTADCVPLLVYDDKKEVIAAIHAGYKGMLAGIIQKAVRMMIDSLGCNLQNMYFALGPCISVKHYEVGMELIEQFKQIFGKRFAYEKSFRSKPHLDLKKTAQMILEDLGMDPLHFIDIAACTYEQNNLFNSYRRDANGHRQFNFIGMIS